MKKYILISIIALVSALAVQAQTGIGARGILGVDGNAYGGLEFSIQKIGEYELDLGLIGDSWKITGLKHVSIVDRNNFGVYGGGGIGIGYYDRFDELFGTFALNLGSYIMLGRLQVGLDWRPEWNFFNAPGNELSFNLALSARWVFGK